MLDSSQIEFSEETIGAELGAMVQSKTFEEMKGWATNEKTEERLRNENLVLS